MRTLLVWGHPIPASISRLQIGLGGLVAFVGLFVASRVHTRMRIRKDRTHLRTLSDHMLEDIGTDRREVG